MYEARTTMASALALYLRGEIAKRGWEDAELADLAEIGRPTLSKILNNSKQVPTLATLAALSKALGVPLAKLITLCGFPVSKDHSAPVQAEQVAILLETLPEMHGLFDVLMTFRPDDLQAILAYAQGRAEGKA